MIQKTGLRLITLLFGIFSFQTLSSQTPSSGYRVSEKDFEIVTSKADVSDAKIQWAISYDAHLSLDANKDTYLIRYATKNTHHSIDIGIEGAEWNIVKDIPITEDQYTIKGLDNPESYVFQVGLDTGGEIIWSKKNKFKTERGWGIIRILILIGALGFFIFGMKVMSEGIQKAAGQRMRNVLNAMTSNRLKGIFTGFLTTTLIQSSSATTVMIVSFVNAGLLTLHQAIGVIMGANIGTTITSWLIVLFGFGSFKISAFSLPVVAIAIPFLFSSKSRRKSWGEVMIGFAILFMGLEFLKDSVPDLTKYPEALSFINEMSGTAIHHVLLAVLIGTIVTIIVQSSSAAMAVTLILCNEGFIPFEMACGMVLGENIGTTITANIAAMIGNTHAKRAARAHFIFNIIGVVWMLFVFKWFIAGIDSFMVDGTSWASPITDPQARTVGLSIFHSSFNIINVLIMVWFVPQIAKIVTKMVPSREGDDDFHLDYIRGGVLATPELSILEAQKEVAKFGTVTSRMSEFVRRLLLEPKKKKKKKLFERVQKYEEITDNIEIEIADYLASVAQNEISETASQRVRSMLSINNDLERIGDIFYQMSKSIERKDEEKIWFTPDQRQNLLDMFDLVDEAFDLMVNHLENDYAKAELEKAQETEMRINQKRDELRSQHLENVERKNYNVQSGMIYNDLFSSLEKIGDHIINVTEAVKGRI